MKEKLSNNLFLKIISIFVAFIVWLVVIDISNPPVTLTKTVTLQIEGEDIISTAGKTYTLNVGNSVNVTYNVRSKDRDKVSADDFKAYIDLGDLYSVTGAVPVNIEMLDNAGYIIGSPIVRPGVVTVSTEDMQRKEFKLTTNTKGEPVEGYSVGTVSIEPENVFVSGPVSVIGRISAVGVEIDVSGASDDMEGITRPVFYDANGNRISIEESMVAIDNEEIKYTVSILKGKTLSLRFNTSGEVAKGYRFMGAESSTKSISVIGQAEDLSELSIVEIPASLLNLNNASADKTITFDISEFLPAKVKVRGNSEVSVTLKVEALNKKSFILELSDMEQSGHTSGYSYKISPEKVTVVVSGVEESLSKLSAKSLGAKIEYSQLTKGNHSGSLKFKLPEGLEIDSYTPFEIIVSDSAGETSTSKEEESTEETTAPVTSSAKSEVKTEAKTEQKTEPKAESGIKNESKKEVQRVPEN